MAVFSHSRLSAYEQCPRKYKFKYVEKLDVGERQGAEAYRGSTVHEALRRLYELVMEGKVWEVERLIEYYNQEWEENMPTELFIRDEELTVDHIREKGEWMLREFYHKYHPFDSERTVALETQVIVDLDPEGKYRVRGFIDRLAVRTDGTLEVHDYKTARTMVKQQKLDDDRQLALYQLGVKQMWPDREKFDLVWHYLAVPEERRSTRSQDDLGALVEETKRLIREIDQAKADDRFPTNETRLCEWCDYFPYCPAKVDELTLAEMSGEQISEREIVHWVNRLAEVKQDIDSLKSEEAELRARIVKYATELGLDKVNGETMSASLRANDRYAPSYPGAEDKEAEKRRFVDFLISSGMIHDLFSFHAFGFDSYIKKARFDQTYRDKLFEMIKRIESEPSLTLRKRKS